MNGLISPALQKVVPDALQGSREAREYRTRKGRSQFQWRNRRDWPEEHHHLKFLERRKQFGVDEREELLARYVPSGSDAQLRHRSFAGIGEW